MSWVEESRALRATVPSAGGLARLSDVIGEPVTVIGPLHGGVATSTFALATPTRELVLKRFRADDESAPLEWERLVIAHASSIPTPEPIALDASGSWFGMHAIVMSRLPGSVVYPPLVDELARTLAAIHETPVPEPAPEVLRRPPLWERWTVEVPYPDGVVDAIEELRTRSTSLPTVLNHCDFHPGNVLVDEGAVSGVVDWSGARLLPRGFDVALMRCDLAVEPGGDAPDRFLAAYEDAAGKSVELLPLFDALAGARAIEHGHGWVDAWTDVGVDVTAELVLERATAFVLDAVSRARSS